MSERIKHLWKQVAFNCAAALLNVALAINTFMNGSWMGLANVVAVGVSIAVVVWLFKRIKQTHIDEKARVVDILSGRVV